MRGMTPQQRDELFNQYKSDIYIMLISLEISNPTATAMMKRFEMQITNWFGPIKRAPIVTAQQAARIMLKRSAAGIYENGSFDNERKTY